MKGSSSVENGKTKAPAPAEYGLGVEASPAPAQAAQLPHGEPIVLAPELTEAEAMLSPVSEPAQTDAGPGDIHASATFGLTEFAEKANLYPQFILNLVTRYRVLDPARSPETNAYQFTGSDLQKVLKVKRFMARGRPIREASELVIKDEEYRQAAQQLAAALGIQSFGPRELARTVEVLSANADLTRQEQEMLNLLDGKDTTLIEAAVAVGLGTEREARAVLNSAYAKIGAVHLHLLKKLAGLA